MKEEPFKKYKPKLKELVFATPSEFKKINCASCSKEIPAENINIHDKIAKCNHCNAVFSLKNELNSLLDTHQAKQEVIRPEGIEIFHFQKELDITIRQPITGLEAIGLGLLPVFTLIFTLLYLKKGEAAIVASVMWLMSLALAASLFFRSRHKIHVTVDEEHLSILWRPKKLHKDKFYKIEEIDQLYVKGQSGYCTIYMIVNGVEGQKHVSLIRGIESLSKARYLEQEIERHLGIADRRIPEEWV